METRNFDLPRYLAVLPLFQEMSPEELQRLALGCRLKRHSRGDTVFRVGEPCEEFHVTVMGQVKLYAISPAGQEKVIELVGPGNSFAEALMFTGKPYIINAQALADTLVLSVGKAAVLAEIERDSRFAMRMLAGISRRLHGLVHDVQAYSLHSGMQRVIGYLLRDLPEEAEDAAAFSLADAGVTPAASAQRRDLRVSLPVSKATIASRLSLTPEYFSRVLHELEAAGLIEIDKREIRIPDAKRLAGHKLQ
ncbi:Crp/Fnr family transcriptional regulator [Rubrivivax gelatinosus]|uniref:Crp/Fnr family transcriptional regulator n=1 Tax=Rubrivivax gelatinosus TaxID=28068 RepID=A0ABS1DYY7_RUBGE|nr:Crp/Fnr family transcriptional regulator [Rubrivivax gelatinosus]MBK1615570.1 Crp/Fnr family transcriptional regulator [Rubrivivax gelatinosus]MBK1714361.1 Crp/Fnr family transcriptional regulator [Rubrivivax gelatinosus]